MLLVQACKCNCDSDLDRLYPPPSLSLSLVNIDWKQSHLTCTIMGNHGSVCGKEEGRIVKEGNIEGGGGERVGSSGK